MKRALAAATLAACTTDPGVLSLSDPATEVALGGTAQLVAVLTSDDGSTEDVTASADWSVDDEALATVDAGLVTGVAPGTVTVTVTVDDQTADAALEVLDPGPYDVSVTGDWGPQHGGQGLSFFARIVDEADGTIVACGSQVAEDAVWSLTAADVLVSGHEYHAEAFADVNGDGEANDNGHEYYSEPKRPAAKDQAFEVLHSGPPPDWNGPACDGALGTLAH